MQNSRAYNWRGKDITRLFWFLSARTGRAACYRCDAPATGYDSNQRPLCCAACVTQKDGCKCYFNFIQKQVAEAIPIDRPREKTA